MDPFAAAAYENALLYVPEVVTQPSTGSPMSNTASNANGYQSNSSNPCNNN